MAQANLRVAAGIGVVAAVVLLPGTAVAVAGPGGSHGGHSGKHDGSGSRGGSDFSDNNITNGPKKSNGNDGPGGNTSAGRPGSDFSPAPPEQFTPPKVTFGDGRTPGIQDRDSDPGWSQGAPEPAPPPPPPPPPPVIAPAPPRIDRTHQPRGIQQLVVAPTSALHDPFFGLAGLLLIPAAGAILGYRQARAAQDAEKLRRT